MVTLIADCGSTKVEWTVTDHRKPIKNFKTTGFNAAVTPEETISRILAEEVSTALDGLSVGRLHFYGAGCIGGEVDRRLHKLLSGIIPGANIEIAGDLLGAARALFNDRQGIACILGTGSNSGLYDGSGIVANVPPMGYILGDEGSGAVLGRQLINHIFKHPGLLPPEIIEDFNSTYGLTKADIIEAVYRRPAANRFLASFCPFLKRHIDEPVIRRLVINSFLGFLSANLPGYGKEPTKLPIGFVGSIAFHFENELSEACTGFGFERPVVIQSPLDGLVRYHSTHPH